MIILLNGTAGSGKGTLSRLLARYLKLSHYDVGLIFRAIAYVRNNHTWGELEQLIDSGQLKLERGRVILSGLDITETLRTEAAGLRAAILAFSAEQRIARVAKTFVKGSDFVADGRTVSAIFPDADWHFQIVANYETAKQRRAAQGGDSTVFCQRWSLDKARYVQSERAVVVNTSGRTPKQCARIMLASMVEH